ncbi:M1 family metallopeptidase [Candidatus Saccharibacteria bacterium]|nr:M1 family metallopeptidase [Candidatus Saccharibacteria bacterium]
MQSVPKLIEQFVPTNYNLSLDIDRKQRRFDGKVIIKGKAVKPESIILHSKELDIKTVAINGQPTSYSLGEFDALIIKHNGIINDEIELSIEYQGAITDTMHGIYPCYYEHEGEKKELIATQFESHYAREAFPCIDEPAGKATFDLTLLTEPDVTVLGNMPIKKQSSGNDKLSTTFQTTPRMSSYLLAWVVGELHSKTAKTSDGIEVNVWATPAQSNASLDFALDIAVKTIEFYNEYFGVPYPLPKCDHVALPDFAAGAMENWGLITYREAVLLVEPHVTSIFSRNTVALVIAHELSHQWFGNLVTMQWWNDLWLNESFASMVEYIAIDHIKPEWDIWSEFDEGESIYALRRDSIAGVQSVQCEVHHPDEISTLFDGAIVYAKGARLMRMLRQYIGEDMFRQGLKAYFQQFAYKNTEAKDLWSAFEQVSDKDVPGLMSAWLTQPGFPVIKAEVIGHKIRLSQSKLESDSLTQSEALWPIPLNSNYHELPELMTTREIEVEIADLSQPLWMNTGNTAHFITNYSHDLLSENIQQVKHGKKNRTDKVQLLNEQSILSRAGITSAAELLPLLEAYENENDEAVWSIISMAIGELKKIVEDDPESELKLKDYAKKIATKQFTRLGWHALPNESESDAKMRLHVNALMLFSDDMDIISEAVNIYKSKPFEELTPEIRSLQLSAFIRSCTDEQVIIDLLNYYRKISIADVKLDICGGLTSIRDKESASIMLEKVKDSNYVKPQDVFRWIGYSLRNKYIKQLTWDWMRLNWNWIEKTFAAEKSYDEYPRMAASILSTPEQLKEFEDFFLPMRDIPILRRNIDMGITEIKGRLKRLEEDGPLVKEALKNL